MNNRKSGPAWPSNVDLPRYQSSMSDKEWIELTEQHIRDIETAPLPDRYRLADTRQALLRIRRFHYACEGMTCPRWQGRLG